MLTNQVIMRVSGLALMTDQAVAAVLSPALLLWEAETVIGGRKVERYIDMAAREWNFLCKEISNNSLRGEDVERIEIGNVDLLRETAVIKVSYKGEDHSEHIDPNDGI